MGILSLTDRIFGLFQGIYQNAHRLVQGLTREEYEKLKNFKKEIMSRVEPSDPDYSRLEKETILAIKSDIQAQRIPPNVQIPGRRNLVEYFRVMYERTGNPVLILRSLLIHAAWTSSGGSFKLAQEAKYELVEEIKRRLNKHEGNNKVVYLEIGAGYAGFGFQDAHGNPKLDGIAKMVDELGECVGTSVELNFTNLTNWHDPKNLPKGVKEHAGYAARDIKLLKENREVEYADIVYSQCGVYFEPRIKMFIEGIAEIIRQGGLLMFNAPKEKKSEVEDSAIKAGLTLNKKIQPEGTDNGYFYVFKVE